MSTHQDDPKKRGTDETKPQVITYKQLCNHDIIDRLKGNCFGEAPEKYCNGKRSKYLRFRTHDHDGVKVSDAAKGIGSFELIDSDRYISEMEIFNNIKSLKFKFGFESVS